MPDHPTVTNIFANGPGNTADATLINQNFEDLRSWLDVRFGNASSGQLWIANASGVVTARTITGDATISNTGVLSIGALKILTALLADHSVTNPKMGLTVTNTVQSAGLIPILSSAYVDLISVTPAAGTYVAIGNVVVSSFVDDRAVQVKFSPDADARSGMNVRANQGGGVNGQASAMAMALPTLDGSTAYKLQALKTQGSASSTDIQSCGSGNSFGATRLMLIPVG